MGEMRNQKRTPGRTVAISRNYYVDSRWIDLPDPLGEWAVCECLLGLQDAYRLMISTIKSAITDLEGEEALSQLDFFIK